LPNLTTDILDVLLSSVTAKATVLFLDCCFSERVLQNSEFFASLKGTNARLFICSSRATQRTWEDQKLKHGVFTAVLLSKLARNTSVSQRVFSKLHERINPPRSDICTTSLIFDFDKGSTGILLISC